MSRGDKLNSAAKTVLQWVLLMAIGALLFAIFNFNDANYFQQWSNKALLQEEIIKAHPAEQKQQQQQQQALVSCPPCPKAGPSLLETKKPNAEECRDVFRSAGQGGAGELGDLSFCRHKNAFNACEDLKDFTGLTEEELDKRIRRKGRFHFEGEHQFWNPETSTELAWYYSTSVNYLFANSAHTLVPIVRELNLTHAPVLDFSGGVGNNVIHLASHGIWIRRVSHPQARAGELGRV